MDIIDEARARTDIERIAAGNPDHVAPCKYLTKNPDGTATPSCIVGVYLDQLGFSFEQIGSLGSARIDSWFLDDASPGFVIQNRFTNKALKYLGEVQSNQDLGEPWAKAVFI